MTGPRSGAPGVVVLAAHRPDPELFAVQLESIRDQTLTHWRCLVGADGHRAEVAHLLNDLVGDDPRFEVVGWDDNVGFYRNFERLLTAVPPDAAWVALSDQDDRWHPGKLAALVPLLDGAALVSGRFRVVGGDAVRVPAHTRHSLSLQGLLAQNVLPGATMVMRRDLLAVALPFPPHDGVTAAHDHWLAVCAAAVDRCAVSPDVWQDYVQHGGNAIGFEGDGARWPALRRRLAWVTARVGSPVRLAAEAHRLSFGWREAMATTLLPRLGTGPVVTGAVRAFAGGHRLAALRSVAASAAHGDVGVGTVATFVVGLAGARSPRPEGSRQDQEREVRHVRHRRHLS